VSSFFRLLGANDLAYIRERAQGTAPCVLRRGERVTQIKVDANKGDANLYIDHRLAMLR